MFWKWINIALIFICAAPFGFAQDVPSSGLKVEPADDVERLVRELFIKEGDCTKVSNIQRIGRREGLGSFTSPEDELILDIKSGLILSSGNVIDAIGPNKSANTTTAGEDVNTRESDLQRLSSGRIFDATGIEFDFVPATNRVSFTYVFASEEYCEYVDDVFNDVFGFFVSGPGISGIFEGNAINVALIPETNDRVAINSVNHLRNSNYYVPNLLEEDLRACNLNPGFEPLRNVEFDGFTVKLTAIIEVIPCETYHIRLVVGDVEDQALDSAVFLEANSFDLGDNIGLDARIVNQEGNTLFEDCLEGEFIFERKTLEDRGRPLLINYQITGEATNGTDYNNIGQQITIPVGQRFAYLPIQGILDDLVEGTERIQIITEIPSCDCIERDTATLLIADNNTQLEVELADELVCIGDTFTIQPKVTNGIYPLSYFWNTQDSTPEINALLTMDQLFSVRIEDACGTVAFDSAWARLSSPPEAILSGTSDWCPGQDDNFLPVLLEGNAPWSLAWQNSQGTQFKQEGIEENPFLLPISEAGEYELLRFEDRQCVGKFSGIGLVEEIDFSIQVDLDLPSCRAAMDGVIRIEAQGGVAPYQLNWADTSLLGSTRTNIGAGEYRVEVIDAQGCIQNATIRIAEETLSEQCRFRRNKLFIPTAFSPNGDAINDIFQVFPQPGSFRSFSFAIYDRWGGLQFQSPELNSNQTAVGWEGLDHDSGVYLCVVQLVLADGQVEKFSEAITLVR